jgi:hypothetical protein
MARIFAPPVSVSEFSAHPVRSSRRLGVLVQESLGGINDPQKCHVLAHLAFDEWWYLKDASAVAGASVTLVPASIAHSDCHVPPPFLGLILALLRARRF